MRYFLSGGSKSGKSLLAQRLAKDMARDRPLYYVATMIPADGEDRARIRRHLEERDGWGFTTVECGLHLEEGLRRCDPAGAFLLDSLTAWLSNAMFPRSGPPDRAAPERVAEELAGLYAACPNLVAVSDDLYSDAHIYDEWTEAYRAGLALVCRRAVQLCDIAIEVCAGVPIVRKGRWPG